MERKTFNIYCDESTHLISDGFPYMILGYVSVAYPQIKKAKEYIKAIKEKHNYNGELKWTNVHTATFQMYKELLEFFFMTDLSFRAVVVDKSQIDQSREDYTFNDFYFRMYYQLLNANTRYENDYNVYLDIKDTCSGAKLSKLKDILKWNSSIRNFQYVRSHESSLLQLADVLMGAVNYNLRIEWGSFEGKVDAKRKIVDLIKRHADISKTTPKSDRKFNLFFINLK